MRPGDFLNESISEIRVLFKHTLISSSEYRHRAKMVYERYILKQELRDNFDKNKKKNAKDPK